MYARGTEGMYRATEGLAELKMLQEFSIYVQIRIYVQSTEITNAPRGFIVPTWLYCY